MRAKAKTLADVLFGKSRGAILALLYEHPDQSYYYRQINRELKSLSVGTLQRELDMLTQLGRIERSRVGKQVFYRANRNHPIFPEMRALVSKTVGLVATLRSPLAPLADCVSVAFLYGSFARQQEQAGSDVDLIAVGVATLEEVLGTMANIETIVRRAVNPTVYAVSEFEAKLAKGNHFLNSVVSGDKIFLIGNDDELRKLGGIGMAETRANQSR